MSVGTYKWKQAGPIGLVAAAVAALSFAVASPAGATIGGSPTGEVDVSGTTIAYHNYFTSHPAPVTGWAIDPNALNWPITVRADVAWTRYGVVIGRSSLSQLANRISADLAPDDPGGNHHGFSITLPGLDDGPLGPNLYDGTTADYQENVCFTAINVGAGSNTTLDCFKVIRYW
jgi:hypothetical protein